MPNDNLDTDFITNLVRLDDGMGYHAFEVPSDVADEYARAGIRRVIVRLNGIDFRRAIQRKRDGRRLIMLGQSFLKDADVFREDIIAVRMRPDPEPDAVDLGEEFAEVLAQDDAARARWETFTIGRQRSLAHYVTSAKRSDTRLKRALELAEKIRTHTLYGDGK